jgi:hypothetical protein
MKATDTITLHDGYDAVRVILQTVQEAIAPNTEPTLAIDIAHKISPKLLAHPHLAGDGRPLAQPTPAQKCEVTTGRFHHPDAQYVSRVSLPNDL